MLKLESSRCVVVLSVREYTRKWRVLATQMGLPVDPHLGATIG